MVDVDFLTFKPKAPSAESIKPENVVMRYNEGTDTLFVHFFGTDRRATVLELDEHLSLRIDAQTHEIVGMQLEGFMKVVVPRNPQFVSVAEYLGVKEDLIRQARRRIEPERAKQAAVASILGEFKDSLLAAPR